MIKAIIFDCFGVLYVDSSRYFYETYVKNYEQLRPQLADLNRQYDIGLLSKTDLNTAVAEVTGLEPAFVVAHMRGVHQVNQPLVDYSQSLRSGFKLGMLSNIGQGGMESYFTTPERERLFDAVVLSSDVGMVKPDPAIFELMALRLGVLPEECVMIDDVEANVSGAKQASMQGIVYLSNEQIATDLAAILAPVA